MYAIWDRSIGDFLNEGNYERSLMEGLTRLLNRFCKDEEPVEVFLQSTLDNLPWEKRCVTGE